MKVVGYVDRLSVAPGEVIRFMVSSELPRYRAEVVRLIHGDTNPKGPGFQEEPVETAVAGEYDGRVQELRRGSYVHIPDSAALRPGSFTLQAWIFPTTPTKGPQTLLGRWSASDNAGYGLALDETGALALHLGSQGAEVQRFSTNTPLRGGSWYFVAASYDASSGTVRVVQEPFPTWPIDPTRATVEHQAQSWSPAGGDASFLIAASPAGTERGRLLTRRHFNGKIESPSLFGAALTSEQLDALRGGTAPKEIGAPLAAAWDFTQEISSSTIRDTSPNALHGEAVQMPARAMKGHIWTGMETSWTRAPEQYGAIHFHDDDLVDAGWDVDFELTVPDSLRSGVYAAKLTVDGGEDYVPFYVRPKGRRASARALFLVPTNSYLAYANEHLLENPDVQALGGGEFTYPVAEQDKYIVANRLHSLYDHHDDGSGVCYSSRLRPIVDMRPKYMFTILGEGHGYPHQFNDDLHLVGWLHAKGFDFDVATDEDLYKEGVDLLRQYKVVLSGSHHEYWTRECLGYLEDYLQGGGRFMYLAGNGLYWVTSHSPEGSHVIEIRRSHGTQSWTANPGEYYHSTTGELGGLWRERGLAPQRFVGVGFTAQGLDYSLPFKREPGSFDPRASWIFEGIGPDETIGDFGMVMEGVAGFEVDRVDLALGSPPHTLILASATGYSDSYQHVIEEVALSDSKQGGTVNPMVRCEMTYFETPNGGAVFSGSSISYCGSLPYNNFDNNVSTLTANVLRRFQADEPLG